MNKLDSYKKMLLEAKTESVFEKVSNLYSDDILEYSGFPNEHLDFLLDVLSESQFYTKKGAFHFLAILGVDTDIMSQAQLKKISDEIKNNYINYSDEMLCLTSCDFIARYYPAEEAKLILLELQNIEKNKSMSGYADDGLRIIDNEEKRSNLTK